MKQPWQALIIHKNEDINLIFPEASLTVEDAIEDVLKKLRKMKHKASMKFKR